MKIWLPLVASVLLASSGAPSAFAQAATVRVSLATTGSEGETGSFSSSVSADGRYIAFDSAASNLVLSDTNGESDVFVRDTVTGNTQRVSVATDGTQGNGYSYTPAISADGRFVAFESDASNLVADDVNGASDVFVRDMVLGTTNVVSVNSDGAEGNGYSFCSSISGNGRFVTFFSAASNLVPGDTNAVRDIFMRDTVAGTTTRVSVATDGAQGDLESNYSTISADGRYVAFDSTASNLVPGDTNGAADTFLRDTVAGTTQRLSVDSNGTQANGGSGYGPSISADGRYVTFFSDASNLVAGDTNGVSDVFLRDTTAGTTTRVSVSSGGEEGNGESTSSTISANGRYVTFASYATNEVPGDTNGAWDVFVRDTELGTTKRVSVDTNGTEGNSFSHYGISVSADGGYAAFESNAFNLAPADTNLMRDIFVGGPLVSAATVTSVTGQNLPARFGIGSLVATQTRPTSFGDNLSEADQLFVKGDGQNLQLGFTGNIESSPIPGNGDALLVYLDTRSGGSGVLNYIGTGIDAGSDRLTGRNGDTFDAGFFPDYALDVRNDGGTVVLDMYDLQRNTRFNLGAVASDGTGMTLAGVGALAFSNGNAAGVTAASAAGAATATQGMEFSLPLYRIGIPTSIKVQATVIGNGGAVSNQNLPGLPDSYGNLPNGPHDYTNYAGFQYASAGIFADVDHDLATSSVAFNYVPVIMTGDPSKDATPAVKSLPTVYNGRAYAVDNNGNLIATNLTNGSLDATFSGDGRMELDGPATGRPVLKFIGGTARLFVTTTAGTLYSVDAVNGANIRSTFLGGTTFSTPAALDLGGVAVVYVPMNNGGTWSLIKATDDGTPGNVESVPLVGTTDVTTSPSIIANGTKIQLGVTTATGGAVYTIQAANLLMLNMVATAGAVKASPILSLDSSTFYVGDAPATGNSAVYAFNTSNGDPLDGTGGSTGYPVFGTNGEVSVSGAIDQPGFVDYAQTPGSPNTLYIGTSIGALYALRTDTGANALLGFPAQPFGAVPVTGAPLLLKSSYAAASGNLYVPTGQGMYVVNTATPTVYSRYPASAALGTPSASGRAAGSIITATGANGNIYGLVAR